MLSGSPATAGEEQNCADPSQPKVLFVLWGCLKGPIRTHRGWDVIVLGTAQKDKQTILPLRLESLNLLNLSQIISANTGSRTKAKLGNNDKTTVMVRGHLAWLSGFMPSWSLSGEGCQLTLVFQMYVGALSPDLCT